MTSRRYHVCILTTAHPTDDVRVSSRIAGAFLERGFKVTWVGPNNSYFRAGDTRDSRVAYRLFEPNTTRARRLTASRRARQAATGLQSVDWWYAPDPDAAALAGKLANRHGGRVLFDIHEVYHGALLDRWFPGRPLAPLRELVRRRIARTCSRADLVIGVSAAVLRPYTGTPTQTLVVRNCAPRWFAEGDAGSPPVDRMRVMHGKAIPTNGAELVEAAVASLHSTDAARLEVYMNHPGGGPSVYSKGLEARLACHPAVGTITLKSGIPHEAMPALLRSCHVGMVAYQRDLGEDSLPNRLFEYMASGLALLAPSYAVEIAEIVEREGIGLLVDFERPEEVAAGLSWMLHHPDEIAAMGERARAAFHERYNWDSEAEKLIETMDAQFAGGAGV